MGVAVVRGTTATPDTIWSNAIVINPPRRDFGLRREHALPAAVVVLLLGILGAVNAGANEPRSRTLRYDQKQREWTEIPPPPPGTAGGDLHAVRMRLKANEFRKTLSLIKLFEKRYGREHTLSANVELCRAQALIGRGDYFKAYEVLQELLNRYYDPEITPEALRLEFVIAETYLGGVKQKLLGLRMLSGVDTAYRILDDISINFPKSELASLAIKTKADHLFSMGDHLLAQLEYERLLRQYPASRYHRFAMRRCADASLAGFAGIDYDETPLLEARERFNEYRVRYRALADGEGVGLILNGIRAQQAARNYSIGRYYERTDHGSSAVFYYHLVCRNWPRTVGASQAKARLALLGTSESTSPAVGPDSIPGAAELEGTGE